MFHKVLHLILNQSNEAKPSDCAKCDDQVRKMVEFRSMGGGHPIRSRIQLQNDMNVFLNFITQSDLKSFRDTRRKIRRAETKILVGV